MISKSTVKYIHSLKDKRNRTAENVFVAEGPKLVEELLMTNLRPKALFATNEWQFKQQALEVETIQDFELQKISNLLQPNQVLALFEKPTTKSIDTSTGITLVLDGIQDPGNLGTIIRTADWFGVQHIVCSQNSADAFNPKVVQSTMASIARVNIVYTELATWLQQQHTPKFAATIDGQKPEGNLPTTAILVIGNEANGISDDVLRLMDQTITIPKIGQAESLNAAVATAILLYAFTK